jgi:hypothetical protein
MWAALVNVPSPYNRGLFVLGGIVLSTDYGVLRTINLEGLYRWIDTPGLASEAEQQYRRKQFIERGPEEIELKSEANGDFRGQITQATDSIYGGLTFWLCVREPYDGGENLKYHLRLGVVKVTDISESTSGKLLSFSIVNWREGFESRGEMERADEIKARLEEGDTSDELFAKVVNVSGVNEFDTNEWRAIADWADDRL